MKYFIIVFSSLISFSVLFSNKLIANAISIEDSLLNEVIHEKNTKIKVANYLNLIRFYQKTNLPKSIEYSDTAIAICKHNKLQFKENEIKIEKARSLIISGFYDKSSKLIIDIEQDLYLLNNTILWGKLYLLKTLSYIYLGDFTKAMESALKSLSYLQTSNDSLTIAIAYKSIGTIYDMTNNSQKALENYLVSREYVLAVNDQDFLVSLDNNIGIIYNKLDDNERALKYYYKSLEYCNQTGNLQGKSTAFNNIASLLCKLNRYSEAMIYYNKALSINHKIQNISSIALLNFNIGKLYYSLNKFDSSEYYLIKSLNLYKDFNNTYGLSNNYNALGSLYAKQKKYNKAIKTFKTSIVLAEKSEILLLQEISLKNLSDIYAQLNNYKLAYVIQQKAITIANNTKKLKKNEELKYYDFQIKFNNQSSIYKKELKTNQQFFKTELNKQKREKYTYALFLVAIIIITIILYKNFRKSNKINVKLIKQNREIEEQKELIEISNIELREQHAFTETLLNTIPNPVFYTNRNNNLLGCNKAFEEITGKSIDALIGLNIDNLNFNTKLTYDAAKIFNNPEKSLIRNESTISYSDGTKHDIICYRKGIIIEGEKLISVLGIIIDITDIKVTETKLKYSEIRLKEALNAKDKFFNIMAHDLKNPFNAILGLTSLISDDNEKHTLTEIKKYSSLINQSATQIYNLLENLLEWARSQSGSIEKNPTIFFINEIIHDCISLFNHSIDKKNITLDIKINKEFKVVADKNMIMTVLRNLLSNAIKFTENNGKINIEVKKFKQLVEISIKDNGTGIMHENLERLFKIDQPISTPGIENEKGTGLGLIICQEFVKQNGGTINVISDIGKGSNFSFTIPCKQTNPI